MMVLKHHLASSHCMMCDAQGLSKVRERTEASSHPLEMRPLPYLGCTCHLFALLWSHDQAMEVPPSGQGRDALPVRRHHERAGPRLPLIPSLPSTRIEN